MFPTEELHAEFSPAPGLGWKLHQTTKHAKTVPVTLETATHHNVGDAEFGSPETPQWTGRLPGTQWSSRDTQRNGRGVHVDDTVETHDHDSVSTNNPSKPFPEVVVGSTRVAGSDKWEESDKKQCSGITD